jgi:hypothetical protein
MNRTRLAALVITWIAAGCGASGATGENTIPDTEEPAPFSCTGSVPANATLCPGSDAGLAADAVRTVEQSCICDIGCQQTPCSYACNPGLTLLDGVCMPFSPPTSISMVQNGDGTVTVTDSHGSLVWLRDANCTETVGGVSRAAGPVSWYEAADWAGGLASGACGLSDGSSPGDWRLPDEFELANVAADLSALGEEARIAFTAIQQRAYWSSFSTCVGIYGVIVVGTGAYSDVPAREAYNVWPVRPRRP